MPVDNKELKRTTLMPPMLNTRQVAEILGFQRYTVTSLCRDGKIKATKILDEWRVAREDLTEFIERASAG